MCWLSPWLEVHPFPQILQMFKCSGTSIGSIAFGFTTSLWYVEICWPRPYLDVDTLPHNLQIFECPDMSIWLTSMCFLMLAQLPSLLQITQTFLFLLYRPFWWSHFFSLEPIIDFTALSTSSKSQVTLKLSPKGFDPLLNSLLASLFLSMKLQH